MKRTSAQKAAGEMAVRGMSAKAQDFYSGTDPLAVYEYDTEDGKRYDVTGCLGDSEGLTFEELEELFESWADELADDEEEEEEEAGLTYMPLWITLTKKKMTKTELGKKANIGPATVSKMVRNEAVNLGILIKICDTLQVPLTEVVEYNPKSRP